MRCSLCNSGRFSADAAQQHPSWQWRVLQKFGAEFHAPARLPSEWKRLFHRLTQAGICLSGLGGRSAPECTWSRHPECARAEQVMTLRLVRGGAALKLARSGTTWNCSQDALRSFSSPRVRLSGKSQCFRRRQWSLVVPSESLDALAVLCYDGRLCALHAPWRSLLYPVSEGRSSCVCV